MAWSKERLYKTVEWSHLTKLGKSRIIQSSFVWLLIVPAVERVLSPLNSVVQDQTFVVSGTVLAIDIGLPFSAT